MKPWKTVIIGLVASVFTQKASAQFSVGLDVGLPVSNFSDIASTGFGGTVRYDAIISDKLGWSASVGYVSYAGKTYTSGNVSIPFGNTSSIPVQAGVKYYFSEAGNGFYGALDLSMNFLSTWVYTINSGNGGGYNLASDTQSKFGFNPGIGYRMNNWDFTGRYNAVGDFSSIGIRVAYLFKTGK